MCRIPCIVFGASRLHPREVEGRKVLEVGACDVNGSLRPVIESWNPSSYTGIDVCPGPGVDEVVPAERSLERFGPGSFDLVISTEMLEHVPDWKVVVANLKGLVRDGGTLLLTTRSRGYPFHAHPGDFWRFEPEDMERIFSEFSIVRLERDPGRPGVFLKAVKRQGPPPADLSGIAIYSMVTRRRERDTSVSSRRPLSYRLGVAGHRLKELLVRLGRRSLT